VTDQADVSERWYDARDTNDLLEFEAALVNIFRDAYGYELPRREIRLQHPRLWGFVGTYGNLDNWTRTWLLIVPAGVELVTVDFKQTLSDGTEVGPFHISAAETRELVGL
jgi:hypothetical protein